MYNLFFYTALFSGFIPFIILVYKNKAFFLKQAIIPFIWLTAIGSLYEFVGSVLLKIDSSYWFQVYSLLEFMSLFYFFYYLVNPQNKRMFKLLLLFFVITYILSFYYWIEYNALVSNTINKSLVTLLVFLFSYLWLKKLFRKMNIPNLWKNCNFYFISGLTIYYASTFLLFLLSDFIINSKQLYFYDYWLVNVLATLMLRVFLMIGVWKMNRN
ncbi:hypothetical protein GGR31_001292 [Mesonia maritima]|uniref:Uncharacterized protein n=1 Tax=Mesonia maritima TaxID=1793873 RepID=A0ABU1K4Y0_9FLAO|nr:hypothetical protein [Mesonia maritima]